MSIQRWDANFNSIKHENFKKNSPQPFSMIVCGSRNQGKSVIIRDLVENHMGQFDIYVVFSNTLSNGWYQQFITSRLMFEEYKPEVLLHLEQAQKERLSKRKKLLNILIIFDDCISLKNKYSDVIMQLFTRGRHLGMSIVFATQTPTMCASIWRQNTTYLILLKCKGTAMEHIVNNFMIDLFEVGDLNSETPKQLPERIRTFLHSIFEEKYRACVVLYEQEGNDFTDAIKTYKVNPE
jgi:hypothetical protein